MMCHLEFSRVYLDASFAIHVKYFLGSNDSVWLSRIKVTSFSWDVHEDSGCDASRTRGSDCKSETGYRLGSVFSKTFSVLYSRQNWRNTYMKYLECHMHCGYRYSRKVQMYSNDFKRLFFSFIFYSTQLTGSYENGIRCSTARKAYWPYSLNNEGNNLEFPRGISSSILGNLEPTLDWKCD